MTGPLAPGSETRAGFGLGSSVPLLVALPSWPKRLLPNAYSWPVEVNARVWLPAVVASVTAPLAPGSETSAGNGLPMKSLLLAVLPKLAV